MYAFGFSLNLLTILAIVLSVGLVVDDAIVVVENVERHVREGRTPTEAALVGARELLGPIVAMTITLATVYAPIGFQGGLTGTLFLEFAITLAAAVVVSGVVALTLSPVMSARFVHRLRQGRPPHRAGQSRLRRGPRGVRTDARRGARDARERSVAAAVLVMLAAWPLYMLSRSELAPVEDQSHISIFYQASPDSTVEASYRDSLKVVSALMSFPEARNVWSLSAPWGGFGGVDLKPWRERRRSSEEMYGEVYGAVSQVPGLRVFPRLDPPLPNAGQYDVELVLQSDAPPEQMLETVEAVVATGFQSGMFLYVDTDLKIDLRAGARDHRPRAGRRPRPRPRGRRPGARHVARRRLREPLQLLRPQLQGDPADRRRGPRDARPVARPEDQDAEGRAGAGFDVHADRGADRSAHARSLPAAQRRAGLRRRHPRRDQGAGASRARDRRGRGPRLGRRHRLRRRVAADPARGLGADRHARLRARAHLPGARGAVPQLPRSADRAARLGAAGDLRRARLQLPGSDHDQHLLAGRPHHARRVDREERHPDRRVRQHAAGARPRQSRRRCARRR